MYPVIQIGNKKVRVEENKEIFSKSELFKKETLLFSKK